jgi:pyruvate/2-oxoglutarate dehydrogenase complex dihydrolipoamide dehydrogenase (E3) component
MDWHASAASTYSNPQVAQSAHGGRGERTRPEREAGASLKNNAMALTTTTPRFRKIVYDQAVAISGAPVGAHAAELIGGALARHVVMEIATNIHPHPSMSELLGDVAGLSAQISIYW